MSMSEQRLADALGVPAVSVYGPNRRGGDHIPDATKLIPGPELDRLIAEKVMGWGVLKWQVGPLSTGYGYETEVWSGNSKPIDHWKPSTDIANAWEVVEHLEKNGGLMMLASQGGCWSAMLETIHGSYNEVFREVGDTAAHAICLAALKAVGHPC